VSSHPCRCARRSFKPIALVLLVSVVGCHRGQDTQAEVARERQRNGNPNVLDRHEMNLSASSFIELIQGRLPGVIIRQRGTHVSVEIRGQGSIRGSNEALIMIDGIVNSSRELSAINPRDVERVEVVKDGAAAIYGVRGANGALLITTRRRT